MISSSVLGERGVDLRSGGEDPGGPVVYWMSRDQRFRDNWALLAAQRKALDLQRPLGVVFGLAPQFLGAALRQYSFMLAGLEEVEEGLAAKGIPFFLLRGEPVRRIPAFLRSAGAAWLFTDFDPLRIKRRWQKSVADALTIPVTVVDAHNIVPCHAASDRLEWAAYTIRPKLYRLLDRYLVPFPPLRKHPWPWKDPGEAVHWDSVRSGLRVHRSVREVEWLGPGSSAAVRALRSFVTRGLAGYGGRGEGSHGPLQSELSPYLHFGQLAPARVALQVSASGKKGESVDAFLEELIVRRELADNFCFYNPHYDSFDGFPSWARETLNRHRSDARPYLYTHRDFEEARTHDALWNAAQAQMVNRGKMHGTMRMYWAKKILEWSTSPEEALETAIALNDRYELDGRDPNGYAGIAWSIGGVHDRAWGERPVFGKVRTMTDRAIRRRFDVDEYIRANGP